MGKVLNKFKILTYNVGIIRKDAAAIIESGIDNGDITWLEHPYKDRFFADPFLIKETENKYYILVEEYLFYEEKGKISVLIIDKERFSLLEKKNVIEEPYHLSFPFCNLNGNTIIPESVASGKTYEYIIDPETFRVLEKREILNEGLIDGVYYSDGISRWLLASHKENPKEDLYLYKEHEGCFIPVNNGECIFSSIRFTRGAGLFFERGGVLYRPVQDSEKRYGYQTNIMRVDHIGDDGIVAEKVKTVNSFNNGPFNETMHTFNSYDGFVIVDGSKDVIRFPMKAVYKAIKRIKSRKY